MKSETLCIAQLSDLPRAAGEVLRVANGKKIFALYGEMGAGKTTLVKAICQLLGSTDNLSSPSFSIVNEYLSSTQEIKIYHLDLYRLNDVSEAIEAGVQEYLYSDDYCLIEWPELIEPLLPEDVVKISITVMDNTRNVAIFIA